MIQAFLLADTEEARPNRSPDIADAVRHWP